MSFNEIALQRFLETLKLFRGLLEYLGGLLGASWEYFGAYGGRLGAKHHFGGLQFFGRAVLESSWGRFLDFWRPFWTYF